MRPHNLCTNHLKFIPNSNDFIHNPTLALFGRLLSTINILGHHCNIENISKHMMFECFFVSLQQNCSEYEENGINAFDPNNHFYGRLPKE